MLHCIPNDVRVKHTRITTANIDEARHYCTGIRLLAQCACHERIHGRCWHPLPCTPKYSRRDQRAPNGTAVNNTTGLDAPIRLWVFRFVRSSSEQRTSGANAGQEFQVWVWRQEERRHQGKSKASKKKRCQGNKRPREKRHQGLEARERN